MNIKNIKHSLYRMALYCFTIIVGVFAIANIPVFKTERLVIFIVFIIAAVFASSMLISIGATGDLDLSDSLFTYIFITQGHYTGIVFIIIYATTAMYLKEKYVSKRNDFSKMFFNISMYVTNAFIASRFANYILVKDVRLGFYDFIIYSVVFIAINMGLCIFQIKLDCFFSKDNTFKLTIEDITLIFANIFISSFVAVTLCEIDKTSGLLGIFLVLGNILLLHYCFHIFRKFQVRNNAIKSLLKITEDVVKYGEFREKCNHLINNMKKLIPYTVCAIYTFDVDNDGLTFPVAYDAPEGIGIGELYFDLSSTAVTIKTMKEGKLHISRDVKKDKKVKLSGKLADTAAAVIIVPVKVGDKLVGSMFIFGGKNLISFTVNGIYDLLNILSNQMALAIENDSIYRDMMNKADIDPLTKLYNRRVLDREIDTLITNDVIFSVVMYDIDDFKKVNDTYGHLAGDEVLRNISEAIRKSIRKTDVACRYGGEEILIIFKDLSKEDAFVISERIRRNIEGNPTNWEGNSIDVTISGGIASFPEDGMKKNDIIKSADDILYSECKLKGKNKVVAIPHEVEVAISKDHI